MTGSHLVAGQPGFCELQRPQNSAACGPGELRPASCSHTLSCRFSWGGGATQLAAAVAQGCPPSPHPPPLLSSLHASGEKDTCQLGLAGKEDQNTFPGASPPFKAPAQPLPYCS